MHVKRLLVHPFRHAATQALPVFSGSYCYQVTAVSRASRNNWSTVKARMPNIQCAITFEAPRTRVVRPPNSSFSRPFTRSLIVRICYQDSLRGYDKRRRLPKTVPSKTPPFTSAQQERWLVMVASGMAACESCSEADVSTHEMGTCPYATSMCSLYPCQYCVWRRWRGRRLPKKRALIS